MVFTDELFIKDTFEQINFAIKNIIKHYNSSISPFAIEVLLTTFFISMLHPKIIWIMI